MRAVIIEKEYEVGDRFGIFLASDLHIDSPDHDRKLLIREFDEAVRLNARIIIAGDVYDFIMNGDSKRYTPSRGKYGQEDAHINHAIDESFNVLSKYAKNIDVMMLGNHESSVVKHHSIDPVAILINRLNRECGADIYYLGYQGFIRYQYKYKNGNSSRSYDIKACHGSGGSSPVTKGTITLNRYMNMHDADLYFSGHTHSKVILPCEPRSYLDNKGNIKWKERKAIVTGAYVNPVESENTRTASGARPYNVNYGDMMRSFQSTGGVMVEHEFIGKDEMITRIIS
jgi:UDP-2,3-diacylglucosamine pyrophosphatase LpxH